MLLWPKGGIVHFFGGPKEALFVILFLTWIKRAFDRRSSFSFRFTAILCKGDTQRHTVDTLDTPFRCFSHEAPKKKKMVVLTQQFGYDRTQFQKNALKILYIN